MGSLEPDVLRPNAARHAITTGLGPAPTAKLLHRDNKLAFRDEAIVVVAALNEWL
ncbi:hypothetical protein [Streptomyces melanogenes]|uniref:hypothetical protein n=1 Tax=Streptomyces melanogenes TaxID=67326 RepID=UPI003793CF8B